MSLRQIHRVSPWLQHRSSCVGNLVLIEKTEPNISDNRQTTLFWLDIGVVKGHLIILSIPILTLLWIKDDRTFSLLHQELPQILVLCFP